MIPTQEALLPLAKIKNGTVIDHIEAGKSLLIIRLLKLEKEKKMLSMGMYLPSPTMGSKDILKIEGKFLNQKESSQVAIISSLAVINIIKEGVVVEKFQTQLPKEIEDFILCPNPKCVTHFEKVTEKFSVEKGGGKVCLRCHWCEIPFFQDQQLEYKF